MSHLSLLQTVAQGHLIVRQWSTYLLSGETMADNNRFIAEAEWRGADERADAIENGDEL